MMGMADLRKYYREVQVEVRKVVWPDRRETVQATAMVVVMVLLVALFLWVVDSVLGWAVRQVI
ncbi:MAG: preprotein translocase subunit SecE [Zetaproteobacteria bacterium]|nr:MAG: preprotein translocase subunit SecE [Zetaproteobacteria bacterium]